MAMTDRHPGVVERSQAAVHGDGFDYTVGSPHLRHATLRSRLEARIHREITAIRDHRADCAVLEIGAGHGFFTETVLAAGASATVTEMSSASFDHLTEHFHDDPRVRVVYDCDGGAPFRDRLQYDVILLISVIHHIPDYLGVITKLCDTVLRPGGTVITFQDPLWYPRRTRWQRFLNWAPYFAWRATRGDYRRGLATRWRRLRGVYSESEPSDLVEYHVVRQGVDESALCALFQDRFAEVELDRYFSTQAPILQAWGENRLPANTFGIVARSRLT